MTTIVVRDVLGAPLLEFELTGEQVERLNALEAFAAAKGQTLSQVFNAFLSGFIASEEVWRSVYTRMSARDLDTVALAFEEDLKAAITPDAIVFIEDRLRFIRWLQQTRGGSGTTHRHPDEHQESMPGPRSTES
jgi:hypothetical protein